MKNLFKIKLNIKGKNIERFIKRLVTNSIQLFDISYPRHNEVNIVISKGDYDKVLKIKTIYEVSQVDSYGLIKIKKTLNLYKFILISLFLAILLIIILSNFIFEIEVVHNESRVRQLLIKELDTYGLSKYKLKKNYKEIQEIKKQIMDKYKNQIEWLEIEESGTKYIVRLEQRIIIDITQNDNKQDVVAKKSGILKNIIATNGTVVKDINTYVNKGDVVISGSIYLNEELKDKVKADGKIYAEVWYNVNIEYPYVYNEINYTGRTKDVYALEFLNKNIDLTFNKFKDKKIEDRVILSHNLLPIKFAYQHQSEFIKIESILTEEEAIYKAIEEAKKKISDKLGDNESIVNYQILKTNIKEDKIILDMFFSVIEDITEYKTIEESD